MLHHRMVRAWDETIHGFCNLHEAITRAANSHLKRYLKNGKVDVCIYQVHSSCSIFKETRIHNYMNYIQYICLSNRHHVESLYLAFRQMIDVWHCGIHVPLSTNTIHLPKVYLEIHAGTSVNTILMNPKKLQYVLVTIAELQYFTNTK